jgi:hypothetical protein
VGVLEIIEAGDEHDEKSASGYGWVCE